jgi:type II secretory pathway pseudopilin PulG
MSNKSPAVAMVLNGAIVLGAAVLFAQSASSQEGQASAAQQSQSALDQQIQMLRKDLRSQRKQIIAQNMNLTVSEAVKFWPIYDQYVSDLVTSNNAKYELIKEYAQADTMTDQQVDSLAKRWLTVDENVVQLRLKYLPIFRTALSAKQTARFFQLDRRVQMMIDLQLASSLPLIEPSLAAGGKETP